MRHDPASAAIVIMLRGLKMYGMAQAVGELMEAAILLLIFVELVVAVTR